MMKIKGCDYSPWDHNHKTSIPAQLFSQPNNLQCHITLGWMGLPGTKHSSLMTAFASYEEDKSLSLRPLGP
jgi:hypothetical protein